MKKLVLTVIFLILLILLSPQSFAIEALRVSNPILAQPQKALLPFSGNEEPPTEEQTVDEITVYKEPVIIGDNKLFYVGDTNAIGAKYRANAIKLAIEKAVKTAIDENQKTLKVKIQTKDDKTKLFINSTPITTIKPVDLEINNLEESQLAKLWKTNLQNYLKFSNPREELSNQNIWVELVMATLFALLIGLVLYLVSNKLGQFIIRSSKKSIYKLNHVVREVRKSNQAKKEHASKATKANQQEETSETAEKEEGLLEKFSSEEEQLEEKVDSITADLTKLIQFISKTIIILVVIAFIDYILFIVPYTHSYVNEITLFVLSVLGVLTEAVVKWLTNQQTWATALRLLALILITTGIITFVNIFTSVVNKFIQAIFEDDLTRQKQLQTIFRISRACIDIGIIAIALILALSEMGFNVAPIIAGASIIGLAISFGSQSLVKDIINGIFILVENQFGIGDIIMIDSTGGVVEDMTLRVTVLRDLSGRAHFIPNGTITKVTTFTKDWARAHLDIGIAYKEDIDTAYKIIMETAEQMKTEFPEKIIGTPEILGVNELGDSAIIIKMIMDTAPAQQWSVEREYRRRIKYAFDANNIEIPFPHRTLYVPQPFGYAQKEN